MACTVFIHLLYASDESVDPGVGPVGRHEGHNGVAEINLKNGYSEKRSYLFLLSTENLRFVVRLAICYLSSVQMFSLNLP